MTTGLLHAGALSLCAPAADGDAGFWRQLGSGSQQVGNQGKVFIVCICFLTCFLQTVILEHRFKSPFNIYLGLQHTLPHGSYNNAQMQ